MAIRYTKHAEERLHERLAGIVTQREIDAALARVQDKFKLGENGVVVKRLGRTIVRKSWDGSTSVGDVVIAVVAINEPGGQPRVTTVQLRNSSQRPSQRWVTYHIAA